VIFHGAFFIQNLLLKADKCMFAGLWNQARFASNAGIQYDAYPQIAIVPLNLLMKE
jgi:hypothetical protein